MKTILQPFQPALKNILFSQRQHSIQPMKAILVTALTALLSAATLPHACAQGFTSGSDGSYGPMNITSNTTLQLPPDGIFRCTTINIAAGATLREALELAMAAASVVVHKLGTTGTASVAEIRELLFSG